jgi:two-component system, chemotaxis family, chemotaxis protein CheY
MNVLIVDDSRALRAIMTRLMKGLGFETAEASHGREAFERLNEHGPFDLVLVDWNMPEMNGYEFLVTARSEARYAAMPIVLVTTETELAQVEKALAAGANEYVMKPFTPDIMRAKLETLGLLAA